MSAKLTDGSGVHPRAQGARKARATQTFFVRATIFGGASWAGRGGEGVDVISFSAPSVRSPCGRPVLGELVDLATIKSGHEEGRQEGGRSRRGGSCQESHEEGQGQEVSEVAFLPLELSASGGVFFQVVFQSLSLTPRGEAAALVPSNLPSAGGSLLAKGLEYVRPADISLSLSLWGRAHTGCR